MSVSVVVPFRSDGAERDRNWKWLRARYETLYPDWELVEGTCEGPWSKGAAVNAAVEAASGDVLVISDADVLLGAEVLREAVRRLDDSAWVVPHRLVYRLSESATNALLGDAIDADPRPIPKDKMVPGSPRKGPPGGGTSVMRRQDFVGIDERFIDWGGEDEAFARAMDTLVGPHRRLGQVMWHLYHEPMPRRKGNRASPASEALAALYLEASGNQEAMRALFDHRPYEGLDGGGCLVAHRETVQEVPMDPRFQGWGNEDWSYGLALTCLKGPAWRGDEPLLHLYHPPEKRMDRRHGSPENLRLWERYNKARFDPAVTRALVEEARESLSDHQPPLHDHPPKLVGHHQRTW